MVRLRKDKIQTLGKKNIPTPTIKSSSGSLVRSIENPDDATLSKDVSKFLKELNLQETAQPLPSTKGKGKQKATPSDPATRSSTVKPIKTKKLAGDKTLKISKSKLNELSQSSRPKTLTIAKELPQARTKGSSSRSSFVFQPTSLWHAALPPLGASNSSIAPTQLSALSFKAAQLHEADIRTFQTSSSGSRPSSSEAGFLSKIIQSGTLSDRLSALTLLVQSSPVHNIKALETLKGMAERGKGKGGREESLKALRCIVDWWVGGGAPSRKLRYFRDQPLQHPGVTNEYLLMWYFEDWLKKYFFLILQILENLSLDPLPYIRTQTISLIFTLIRDKPEQEQNLLRLLVNKLGDSEKSLCSRASYHVLQLLQTHPSMKAVVVKEIIALIMKPSSTTMVSTTSSDIKQNRHIRFTDGKTSTNARTVDKEKDKKAGNPHAKYYAAVTFNQIVLAPGDREVSLTLLDVYFEMFKEILGTGDVAENDDFGTEAAEGMDTDTKTDKHGRVQHGRRGQAKSGGSRKNEFKGAAGFAEVEDANSKLVSAILTGVNRALPFAKVGAGDAGIIKHIDTLFLITHTSTFNISLQALILIQQIVTSLSTATSSIPAASEPNATVKSITDRYYRALYSSLHDIRLASSSKQAMYLNLFFKSVKADVGSTSARKGAEQDEGANQRNERIKALIRRFTQVLLSGGGGATEFVAGGLYLLGELFSSVPGLREIVTQSPPEKAGSETLEPYDPRKRDPQYAHASSSPLWELTPLLHHYHPAISLHTRQLLQCQPLTASADLSQNTLSHFLDRFVYKNPKKPKGNQGQEGDTSGLVGKGPSAMQPAASGLEGVKLIKGEMGYTGEEVLNEKAFLKRRRADVPVDQRFFHDYFTRKHEKEKVMAAKGKKKDGADDDSDQEESGDDDDNAKGRQNEDDGWDEDYSDVDEAEIWKVMKATMPKVDNDNDLMDDSDDADEEVDIVFDDDSDLAPSDESEGDIPQSEEEDAVSVDEVADPSEDGISLVEASDNEDLYSLDQDVDIPEGLIEYDGSSASEDDEGVGHFVEEEEEWGGISAGKTVYKGKRKHVESDRDGKRKKLRSLPTFASYEDYAKLIDAEPQDNL